MRRGVTLLELAVTMVVSSLVLALLVRAAVFHERLQRHERAAAESARATRQTVAIVAGALAGAMPSDLIPGQASDTALDLMAPIAFGIGCLDGNRLVLAGTALAEGPAFTALNSSLREGDRVLIYDDRRTPRTWVTRTISAIKPATGSCATADAPVSQLTTVWLDASLAAGPVVAFHVSRRTRFTLYRSGDALWYLGMREWNSSGGGFSGIQPVTGPLGAKNVRSDRTGLRFAYIDSTGSVLAVPLPSGTAVAGIMIIARSADSLPVVVSQMVAVRRD